MKYRNGFVSNSSSSSFCMYGVELDKDSFIKILDIHLKLTDDDREYIEEEGAFALLDIAERMDYRFITFIHDDYHWVGRDPFSIADNESGMDFRQSVQSFLDKAGVDIRPQTIHEVFYD